MRRPCPRGRGVRSKFAVLCGNPTEASMAEFLQILASGLTVGAIYALIGIGFSMIYNTSDIINFAQGEFVMIGGMSAVALSAGGTMPLVLAVPAAIAVTVLAGLAVERLAIEPVRHSSLVTLIIITIGVSITIRGAVEILLGKNFYRLASFSGDVPVDIGGAQVNPQAFWVVGSLLVVMAALDRKSTRLNSSHLV